jgi:Fe-S-cluster containining protein
MMRESMCDTCMAPGACCREITLGGGTYCLDLDDPAEVERRMREGKMDDKGRRYIGSIMPFKVLRRDEESRAWIFSCPKLDPMSGRCTIYAERPFCCSDYKPGQDGLCVHHWADPA